MLVNPFAADVWSLGVVLYSMVIADFPFRNVVAVLHGEFEEAKAATLSPHLNDLVRRMLVIDPEKRCTIEEVLHHPWLHMPNVDVMSPQPSPLTTPSTPLQ